jgi:hypothetical protein
MKYVFTVALCLTLTAFGSPLEPQELPAGSRIFKQTVDTVVVTVPRF